MFCEQGFSNNLFDFYSRPIVTLQIHQLLRSRTKNSAFMTAFVHTQAVECYAEWLLIPNNWAFKHVQNGVYDPIVVGDKGKWYSHNFIPEEYIVWNDNTLGLLKNLQVYKCTGCSDTVLDTLSGYYDEYTECIEKIMVNLFSIYAEISFHNNKPGKITEIS